MLAGGNTKKTAVIAVWLLGVVISAITFFVHLHRHREIDLSLRSPFDNTRSGHAEQWIFLREAAEHIPDGASFTVLAQDRDTEMSLFMMSVGLLPESLPLPSSYYGQAMEAGEGARFVLEFGDSRDLHTRHAMVTAVPGGRVKERRTHTP